MNSNEVRERYLNFFEKRKHAILPSAPLVPENDPSVLFNTAGMQPLVPYLSGVEHPSGKRLVNIQKCIRTNDIEEVGDKSHLTFFEMLGHWSLGDYFKEEEIPMMYEFLTSTDEGLGLDPKRLYFTVFEGDEHVPRDDEAVEIWKKIVPQSRIYYLDAAENFWSAGDSGPCGGDTEYFYDTTEKGLGDLSKEEFIKHSDSLDIIEICNSVFMEYEKKDGKVVGKLKNKNVDFGGGLERLVILKQGVESIYETDLFKYFIDLLEKNSKQKYTEEKSSYRVAADHFRAAVFMVSDGVFPSNKDQGYILRRLIRRTVVKLNNIDFDFLSTGLLITSVIDKYSETYPNLAEKKDVITDEIDKEIKKFQNTLKSGLKRFEKLVDPEVKEGGITKMEFGQHGSDGVLNQITGEDAFELFTSFGFPLEIIKEEAEKRNLTVDEGSFFELLRTHQEKSRTASAGKFKGGLGGESLIISAFHTSTHLLLAGLREVLGGHVHQAGSNITDERLRFDFTHGEKVNRETLDKVEEYINNAIDKKASVKIQQMDKKEAKDSGVEGSFWEKYPETVTVYTIEDNEGNIYSKELCGGPHVENTDDISKYGKIKIKKESSSSAGVRRIKAVFEK